MASWLSYNPFRKYDGKCRGRNRGRCTVELTSQLLKILIRSNKFEMRLLKIAYFLYDQ
jgi:hypothetical protein